MKGKIMNYYFSMTMLAALASIRGLTSNKFSYIEPLKCENEIKEHTCPCCGDKGKRDQAICSKECLLELRKRKK